MTVIVSKKLARKDIDDLLGKIKKKPRTFDAKKYFGKAKVKGDPLQVQQEMRDE